jgi:hypothetical protein
MIEPAFISVREAAVALFGRYNAGSRDRVYRFIERGIIKGVRDGRKWWIPQGEIERMRNLQAEEEGGA